MIGMMGEKREGTRQQLRFDWPAWVLTEITKLEYSLGFVARQWAYQGGGGGHASRILDTDHCKSAPSRAKCNSNKG
jgi:hypothetical protein